MSEGIARIILLLVIIALIELIGASVILGLFMKIFQIL